MHIRIIQAITCIRCNFIEKNQIIMAIEKGKVVAKLLVKYKGTSLTKNFIENIGARYAAKLPDDADDAAIDEYINDRDDIVQDSIKETDKRVTDAVNKAKKPNEQQHQEENKDDFPSDMPEWAKTLAKGVQALTGEVTGMKTEKTQQTLSQRFQADPRLKGIDAKLLKGRHPTKEEDYEAFVTEAADDLKEFVKDEGAAGASTTVGKFGRDKPNLGTKGGNQEQQQTAATKNAVDKAKAYVATLPGNKAKAAQKSTEV
jgi:hypothetical protein